MNRKIFSLILLSAQFLTFQLSAQTTTDPSTVLPDSIDGWKKLGDDRTFDNETLYSYIDGAAELYISFGFSKVFNRNYSYSGDKEIIVDIFYMNTPPDAFGAFSFSIGKIGNEFGTQSQTASGAIVFWKDNYYVSITCNPETEESKKVSLKLARLIDDSIKEKGEFPEVLKYLPAENLDEQSIRYFRHYVWLNSHIFISNDNILNINPNTHAVLAKYGDKEKLILLLVKYTNASEALTAKEKFVDNYNKALKLRQAAKTKNGKYCAVDIKENFLVAAFNGSNAKSVLNLINRAKDSINRFTSTKNK